MKRWAYVLGLVLAASFAYDVARIPVQVTDSLVDILESQEASSAAGMFIKELSRPKLFRPLKAAQIRIVSDLSQGNLTLGYRATHVILLLLTAWMFVRVMEVNTSIDLAAAALALTILLGMHTFANLLREAFPINHFLEMVLFALTALRLSQGQPGWRADVGATLLFAAGALIVESGLLVWVVLVAAYLSGMRGVSRRGLAAASALLCVYAYLRFVLFSTGMPMVNERSSGFFLGVLEPADIQARFGANPLPFYAYNIAASVLTVLFAEPRAGQLITTAAYVDGQLAPWMVVAVVSSVLTTMLIAAGAIAAWRDRDHRTDSDRFFFIAAAVIAANAVLSYGYLKDDILSVAGAFYALAAYAAVRRVGRVGLSASRIPVAALAIVLVIVSVGWTVRTAGLHYSLRYMAFKTRNEWSEPPPRGMESASRRVVTLRLRRDALERRVLAPRFYPAWEGRWFEE